MDIRPTAAPSVASKRPLGFSAKIRTLLLVFLACLGGGGGALAVENQFVSPNLLTVAGGNFSNADDAYASNIPIGFPFTFGGTTYSTVSMSTNGVLYFASPTSAYTNTALLNRSQLGVYALWDDLYVGNGSDETLSRSLYYTTGVAGSRVFIMQWTSYYSYAEPYEVGTFNVVLYEGSNKIDIYYRNMLGTSVQRAYGASATIGLVATSSYSTQFSQNSATATEGKLLTYTPASGGNAPYSLTEQVVTPATAAALTTYYLTPTNGPQTPVNLSAQPSTPSPTSVSFSWDLSPGGQVPTGYKIRYATNPQLSGVVETAPFSSANRTYVLAGLSAGVTYYWQVVSTIGSFSSFSTISTFTQAANNPPVATGSSFSLTGNGPYNGILSATDADNTPNTSGLIYSIVTPPAFGSAVITNSATGAFSYTPPAGFSGNISFTFKAFDGTAYSNEATVTATIIGDGPAGLTYATNPATYVKGATINPNLASHVSGTVDSYSVLPALPAGLSLNPTTGTISGTPTAVAANAIYVVTATGPGGSTTAHLQLTVNDIPPANLTYIQNPILYTKGIAITPNNPSTNGGTPVAWSSDTLPDGLSLDPATGVLSGTPTTGARSAGFVITATNSGGFTTANLVIRIQRAEAVSSTPLFTRGDLVPGAGTVMGVPADAAFASFGIPSINDAGTVAFAAKWKSKAGAGTGIFVGNPAVLVIKAGDIAFGEVTFKRFGDPVLNAEGKIAFSAILSGVGVTSANSVALFTNATSSPPAAVGLAAFPAATMTLVARRGDSIGAADGATLGGFTGLSLQGGEVLFVARLLGGTPLVTSANNRVAYVRDGFSLRRILRTGDVFGTTTIKGFSLLATVGGTAAQNRAHVEGNAAFLTLLTDKTRALVDGDGHGLSAFLQTGSSVGSVALPAATFKSFGVVAAPDAENVATLGVLNVGADGVISANAKGIFVKNGANPGWMAVARISDPSPIAGAIFNVLKDPILAPETGSIAFGASIKGLGVVTSGNDFTLWWKPGGGDLSLIAREGGQPVGTPIGVKWKAFRSLAVSGSDLGGPLFTATMLKDAGGVGPANDMGLWAVDGAGVLRLLIREGNLLGVRTVKTFTVLTAVSGSSGVSRSFNGEGEVILRVVFMDGSSSIVKIVMP